MEGGDIGLFGHKSPKFYFIVLFRWLVNFGVSRRGGVKVKGVDGGIVILASYKFNFIRVHDNLIKLASLTLI